MLGLMDNVRSQKENPTIHDLYPHLNETQLKETEENLDRYLEVVLQIYEHLERDQTLTASKIAPIIDPKRSNPA